jgi:hypothetical protein
LILRCLARITTLLPLRKYEESVIHFTFMKTLLNYDVGNKVKELMEGGNTKSGPEQFKRA